MAKKKARKITPKKVIESGTSIDDLWPEKGGTFRDDELVSLAELSQELDRRGIIARERRSLYISSVDGHRVRGTKTHVRLKAVPINGRLHSSVRWYREFLAKQEEVFYAALNKRCANSPAVPVDERESDGS